MTISAPTASELVENAKQAPIKLFFHLSNTGDDCIVELKFCAGDDVPFVLTESWYNTDCVGPSHGGTKTQELTEAQAVTYLATLVEEPYERTG